MEKKIRLVDTTYKGPQSDDSWLDFVPAVAVMATCIDREGTPNIIPLIGWGVMSRFPYVIAIAVCHSAYTKNYFERNSLHMLKEVPEFVLNIPHVGLRDAISVCGKHSGDGVDKFVAAGLTPKPSAVIRPPVIEECPVNVECKIIDVARVGSHDVFFGEAVAVHSAIQSTAIDEDVMVMTLHGGESVDDSKLFWRTLPWWTPRDAL